MKILLWILTDEQQSRTCALNRILYLRSSDGRSLASFSHPQVEVGEYTYGLRRESFFAYHPKDRVKIGKFCSIADGVKFVFGEHRLNQVSTFPFRAVCLKQETYSDATSKGHITIENDVWIGANAIVLSGVHIGNGAVIAAGALISKSVPAYAVVGGVPARLIRYRLRPEQIESLLSIQWWNWPIGKIKSDIDLFYGDPDAFIQRHQDATHSMNSAKVRSE